MNSVHSFTAGRFVSTNVTSRTVPRMADIPVEDLWNHLNSMCLNHYCPLTSHKR